jgi:hypothetical protein
MFFAAICFAANDTLLLKRLVLATIRRHVN